MQKFFSYVVLIFLIAIKNSFGASSNTQIHTLSNTQSSIIGSIFETQGQKKIIIGVKLNMPQGWKTYGNDNSGIGIPPQFDLTKSSNYRAHQVFFPTAHEAIEKIGTEEIKYQYYDHEIIFPITFETLDSSIPTTINLHVDFALCKDVCVPVSQDFSLNIDNQIDIESLKQIEKFYNQPLINKNSAGQDSSNSNLNNFNEIDLTIDGLKTSNKSKSLLLIIALAFIGGAILNIMPCVLPVISIKLISIIKHSNASLHKIRFSFFSTILGILSCFVILALITFTIRSGGNLVGWGFQFQNPYFLIFLIIILVFFIAELLGVFEISFNQFIANLLNKKIDDQSRKNNIFIPNFLSGILAVLLATPCSAPFLGSAISFAITQSFLTILTIFIFIGLGFAFPYLILIISPRLVNLLPKSGSWMIKVKHLMAGFLVATNCWLLFILSNMIGLQPSILLALLALAIFILLKLNKPLIKIIVITILVALSFTLPIKYFQHQQQIKHQQDSYWQVFDESILNNLIAENKLIIVDVTADWCLTCKVNKILVLDSAEINEMLKKGEIIGLRADITKPDDAIMQFLAKHNRYAIPFNAVYGPNARNGLLASELLSKKELLEIIDKAR